MSGSVLEVSGLRKSYGTFALRDVSFDLREGTITGFIGRNGAGKTTTLKCLLNLVHPDGGEIRFFGLDFAENELDVKRQMGFVSGGVDFYPRKKLRTITEVTRRLYSDWDETAYRNLLRRFSLDEDKTAQQLSAGMKVKYALALALSHRAKLLILDEPTSGLDPVSREELLELFLQLKEEGATILFSTHITSDLDKCADDIIYIRNGAIAESDSLDEFISRYLLVRMTERPAGGVIGTRPDRNGYTGLIRKSDPVPAGAQASAANLEDIMVHLEKEE